jgi:hypothetical protein
MFHKSWASRELAQEWKENSPGNISIANFEKNETTLSRTCEL